MQQIYALNLWGNNKREFFSGEGSHKKEIVEPYIHAVKKFLQSFKTPISICDLGCGDFNIGCQLLEDSSSYTAVDIVPELILYNKKKYKTEHLKFLALDMAKDEIPKADCVIIRQVLQHLSNHEIIETLKKVGQYRYLILTEHLPNGSFEPNKDIISGQGIRIKKNSGVNLLAAPFNMKVKRTNILLETVLQNNKGVISTILYEL